jgi:hypothetical protein
VAEGVAEVEKKKEEVEKVVAEVVAEVVQKAEEGADILEKVQKEIPVAQAVVQKAEFVLREVAGTSSSE